MVEEEFSQKTWQKHQNLLRYYGVPLNSVENPALLELTLVCFSGCLALPKSFDPSTGEAPSPLPCPNNRLGELVIRLGQPLTS